MEMILSGDRRATRRSVLVDCQVVRERGFELIGERATDLSMHGMLLSTRRPVEVGEELIATLRVPGTRVWIDTFVTVARLVRGRRGGDLGVGVGLAFGPLDGEEQRLLRNSLLPFPPTYPARPLRIDYAATAAFIALA